ncbi:DASH complex subunit dam1 [Recurvomyces mirabilis]|nr:DASH complex subunit dam1 [Recurvomyces mirabilis]
MASKIPATAPPGSTHHHRTSSHSKTLPSRPTTPLRPPSRTSLRASQTTPSNSNPSGSNADFPLASLEGAFAEFSDSMADLEANFMHLQLLNESLGRFNENFGAFLYGLNMSAFCVDFPEAPIPQSFARHATSSSQLADSPFRSSHPMTGTRGGIDGQGDADATFLTTDTSFVDNPPMSSKPSSKYSAPPSAASSRQSMMPGRGTSTRGRAGVTAGRGARGSTSGVGRGVSGVARGTARGRGSVR